jgi:hypothetical protein
MTLDLDRSASPDGAGGAVDFEHVADLVEQCRLPGDESGSLFVGRLDALARVHAALTLADSGHAGIVVVTGAAGIGKTALVDRFLAAAVVDQVLRASGEEAETSLALGVIDQLLAAGTGVTGGRGAAVTGLVEPVGRRRVRRSAGRGCRVVGPARRGAGRWPGRHGGR